MREIKPNEKDDVVFWGGAWIKKSKLLEAIFAKEEVKHKET